MNMHIALRRLAGAFSLTMALLLAPAHASANAPAKAVEKAKATAFGAAEQPRDLSKYKEEQVPGGTYLVIAYGVIWALVAGLVGRMLMGQARLEARITEIEEQLDAETP